ncbi:LysR family transcriptional regulator [Burkholderia aenigmatica]|uniref:LysR family transcriptional regulator n=1 Tax=Burkholderia aenigmatica TaxID=2015348 RepID=A0A6J5JPI2_9BURK|nr:LysR family transcriptional regulator [Burkholderia aenigmatica]
MVHRSRQRRPVAGLASMPFAAALDRGFIRRPEASTIDGFLKRPARDMQRMLRSHNPYDGTQIAAAATGRRPGFDAVRRSTRPRLRPAARSERARRPPEAPRSQHAAHAALAHPGQPRRHCLQHDRRERPRLARTRSTPPCGADGAARRRPRKRPGPHARCRSASAKRATLRRFARNPGDLLVNIAPRPAEPEPIEFPCVGTAIARFRADSVPSTRQIR